MGVKSLGDFMSWDEIFETFCMKVSKSLSHGIERLQNIQTIGAIENFRAELEQ